MDFHFLDRARRPHLTVSAAIVFGIVMGVLIGSGFYFLLRQPSSPSWSMVSVRSAPVQNVIPLEQPASSTFVDSSFKAATKEPVPKGSRIILIPHHLVAAREIASILLSLPQPKNIILLAPDHLGVGKTDVTVGDQAISANDQVLHSNPKIAAGVLSAVSQARADEGAISRELSMQALLPFISHAFPKASITPILMQIGHDKDERAALAKEIQKILQADSNTILISTVDFSHYMPASVADFHDVLAEDVIDGLANLETDRVELDCAGVLAVTLNVARELGLGSVDIHAHTNSLRILESKLSQESTSHFVVSFSPGAIQPQRAATMLFLGDMMFDRTVRDRMAASKVPLYPFDRIIGQEERFFRGQDVIMANLEGPVTAEYRAPQKENDFAFSPAIPALLKRVGISVVSQANNHTLDQGREGADDSHGLLEQQGIEWVGDQVKSDAAISLRHISVRDQEIAMIGLNNVGIPIDYPSVESILAQAATSTYRVVYMHWGEEYHALPSENQTTFAHWLIDHGVDAVIGAHPHWMEGVEVYKNKPIAYSLGNFIFDQDWSTETQFGLTVGLVLRPNGSELHLFPVKIDKSQPVLLTGDDRQSRLDVLANISDASLSSQIRDGVVRIGK